MKSQTSINAVAIRFICILALACVTTSTADAKRKQLHYWTEKVTLRGKLVFRTFYGPPGYGENPKTDSKETQSIVLLDRPFDVIGDKQDPFDATERGIRRVTLVFSNPIPHPARYYLKRRVKVEGTLFHAFTGHHHTKILVDVTSIRRAT
jgi:Domain of unknown function (DUF4431)